MLVALAFALVPFAVPQVPAPLNSLVSAYTPGEQLCLEVTPDPSITPGAPPQRGFLAEGATITMLNLMTNPPTVIERHQVPYCQPLAMRYYNDQATGEKYLFIAGGTHGVWRLTLCPNLFLTSQPLNPCGAWYDDLWVQIPIETGFERKRCVDVEVLETGPTTPPVLFALFAASSDLNDSVAGPTELHAYTWDSQGATQIEELKFGTATSPVEVGTCLAVDPADNNSIYVGMGKGGIRRVDLAYAAPNYTLTEATPATWTWQSCQGTNDPEHVRDIAIVRVNTQPAQSVLYAALNYEELLEITDLGGGGQACTRTQTHQSGLPWGLPERIAACTDSAGKITHVAVSVQSLPGKKEDSRGPFTVNGFWSDICLRSGAPDANAPNPANPIPSGGWPSQLRFYTHDFTPVPPSPQPTYLSRIDYPTSAVGELGSNTIILQPRITPTTTDRVFHCSREVGTEIYDLNFASLTLPITTTATFVGEDCGAQEGVISLLNPGVMRFFSEHPGATTSPARTLYLDPLSPYGVTPVPQTGWSPCANDYPGPSVTCNEEIIDPELYSSNIFGEAHWLGAPSTGLEYFLEGRRILERYQFASCSPIANCPQPYVSPCNATGDPTWWQKNKLYNYQGQQLPRSGLRVVRLTIPSVIPPGWNGPSMLPNWWDLDLADWHVGQTDEEQAAPSDDRALTLVDTRTDSSGRPSAAYQVRSGTGNGVKALEPSTIESLVNASCGGSSSPGVGEVLAIPDTAYRSVMTHLELELFHGIHCAPISPCGPPVDSPAGPHQLNNNHADLYRTRDLNGRLMWVLAIASGFPASFDPQLPVPAPQQDPNCQWIQVAGRPMLVLVDVTSTGDGSFGNPTVLRVALGPGIGHAISVRTKHYGPQTYAFVGDIMGKIWVFDVTGSGISPAAQSPYLPSNGFLQPIASLPLPMDPFDGYAANCIDMEIVDNFLYCALGRHGVGIVDISDPSFPQLIDVMDTPGLALGLSQRTVSTGTQLIVGDSRCGLRIYQ